MADKKIIFITSIRHPQNSNSYERVWDLLKNTLFSICNQTNPDFKVIVVANEVLDTFENESLIKPYVEFVRVGFPPPPFEGDNKVRIGMGPLRLDRSTKYIIGLLAAQKHNPEYIMFCDADDFISSGIVSYINAYPQQDGWFIDKGYGLNLGHIYSMNSFHQICGTCNIIRTDLITSEIDINNINIHSKQSDIVNSTNDYYLKMILGSHKFMEKYFEKKNRPMKPFPYRAAIYNVFTGENHSASAEASKIFNLNDNIIKEFNLPFLHHTHFFTT